MEQQNPVHQGHDEQPHRDQMQDQSLVHQENDEQEHNDPIQNHPQVNQEKEQQIDQVNQEDQIANDQLQDPNIDFIVLPNPNIPQRVTRSRNNISKQSTKYDHDYVTVLKHS